MADKEIINTPDLEDRIQTAKIPNNEQENMD